MNTVSIDNVNPGVELVSIDDMAAFLNLTFREVVDFLLEFITIFSDDEMIQEINDLLDLNITGVVDYYKNSPVIVGYIPQKIGGVAV